MTCVLHCREQRYPTDSSIIPGWKGKHTRCAVPQKSTHTCRFCRPKSRASPAPAALHSWDFIVLWCSCSIFLCPGAKPSGKHLGRAAHPLACKLCTWGKMLRKKKKAWNFHWLQVMLPKAVSEDEWSNEAQSREPFLGLPQSPHPLAQILAAQHHLRLHQQEPKAEKFEGFAPSISWCSLLCDLVHFLSLVSCLDPNRSQVAKGPKPSYKCSLSVEW